MSTVIGVLRNNWRQRLVYVYAIEGDPEHVKTVGKPFDPKTGELLPVPAIECVENIDAWRRTIALFPKTAVYD